MKQKAATLRGAAVFLAVAEIVDLGPRSTTAAGVCYLLAIVRGALLVSSTWALTF